MTALYVDSASGSDSNAGTAVAPWATLAKLAASITSDDTAFISGVFRESVTISGLNNITINQWSGMPTYEVRGDIIPTWTLNAGVYETTLGAGVTARTVVWNWDTNLDINFNHFGHLVKGTFGALAAGEWAQSGTTLQIKLDASMNAPTTDTFAYVIDQASLFEFHTCTNSKIINSRAKLVASSPTNTTGYGFKMSFCTNCELLNCKMYDCGAHSFGFVNVVSGTSQGSARITLCQCFGLFGGGPSGQNHLVFFSEEASGVNNAVASNNTYHLYGAMSWTGAPLNPQMTIIGSFQHGSSVPVSGVTWQNETYIGYDGHVSQPYGIGNSSTVASDENDPSTYPVRYIDCQATNCTQMALNYSGNSYYIAHERCFFDLTRAGRDGMRFNLGGAGVGLVFGDGAQDGTTSSRMLNQSSVILFDNRNLFIGTTPSTEALGSDSLASDKTTALSLNMCIGIYNRTKIINQNSTLLALNNSTNPWFWFINTTDTTAGLVMLKNVDTIIASHNNKDGGGMNFMFGSSSIPASAVNESDDNIYFPSLTKYLNNILFDTEAEYSASIDTNGTFNVNPDLTNLSNTMAVLADAEPVEGGYTVLNPSIRSGVSSLGINGLAYTGHLCAFQFGATHNQTGRHKRLKTIGVMP